MFEWLKIVAAGLRTVLDLHKDFFRDRQRKEKLLAVLTAYFCLDAILKTGRLLLDLAGSAPIAKAESLPREEAQEYARLCQAYIAQQLHRLQVLGKLLEEQAVLDLADPSLRAGLASAIGTKGRGLFGVGSVLFFYLIFGQARAPDDLTPPSELLLKPQGEVIPSMYPRPRRKGHEIDVKKAASQLESLAVETEQLRALIWSLATREEILELADEAKRRAVHEFGDA